MIDLTLLALPGLLGTLVCELVLWCVMDEHARMGKLWNRAKLNMPTIGTEVCVVDPVEDKPDRVGKVVAVNRIANTLDVMFPDGSREGGVPREYTSTGARPLHLAAPVLVQRS